MNEMRETRPWGRVTEVVNWSLQWLSAVAYAVAPIMLRVALALPFFRSGLTKWDGFLSLSPAAGFLFAEEFKLHVFGQAYDLPSPEQLAFVTASAEMILPVLLTLGLATRYSALGLLGMTAVIQLIVPDGWANFHLPWATMAVALIAIGPGRLSVDYWLGGFFGGRSTV